ncbi:regulator of G-protein signaling 14 isoform X2 [Dunckerocampus dactyliophorus]|uniref:regulator of G-protein signaling 14 isoform X2 n=1 Tax=Dunckerocampus dactyliophorus TaxID=161453 RepID=UPI0024055184|nr:regulator of G-protein signaling 14 isoform X2 [Dunckerocampus dactyliophorus]
MVAFKRLYRRFSCLMKVTTYEQLRKYDKWRSIVTEMASEKSLAMSDGELNMSARSSAGSSSSLPGTPGGESSPANSVLSWAVSFEKLLEDPCGVGYFTAFLRSEVSAENILFWQSCEKFRKIPAMSLEELKAAARSIYEMYLSEKAPHSVNIDDTAKTDEKDLEQPTPDMFNKAQAQIFKLMKMDSYRRFVRSSLYQSCTLASVEGKRLPQLSTEPFRTVSWEEVATRSPNLTDKKSKTSDGSSFSSGKIPLDKRRQKRGSLGDTSHCNVSSSLRDSVAVKSSSNVELDSLYRTIENGQSSPRSPEQVGVLGGRCGMEGGYCCVYLPDGSASLAPTRNGLPIRDMLAGLCEKRGFSLKDVVIYLHGKDKQPLSLDQDCCVLRDQQVLLELRVTFVLENAFTGKTGGIMAKSSKTLQDALSTVLQKHSLKPHEAQVTIVGSDEPVNMNTTVFRLANKMLRLDKVKAKDQGSIPRASGTAAAAQAGSGGPEARLSPQTDKVKTPPKPRLLDMLTRAQCCRVDDQRGLLTKEQLEVPLFLQLPPDQGQDVQSEESSTNGSSTANTSKVSENVSSSFGLGDSEQTQDLRETSV